MLMYAVHVGNGYASSQLEAGLSLLSRDKERRIRQLVRREDQVRSTAGQLLSAWLISAYRGVFPESSQLTRTTYGKPYWLADPECCFNISHSGEWVVGVIGGVPVGIDVEEVQDIDLSVSDMVFSAPEREALSARKGADAREYFYTLWTCKESCLKAMGTGFSYPPRDITIQPEAGHLHIQDGDRLIPYTLRTYDALGSGYKLAVCARGMGSKLPLQPEILDAGELLEACCLQRLDDTLCK
ncbi:4'-phosphopantetheinyl transferase family protein [Paenibacillus sp. JSM ZJ436]|uniref:4'-phosphopantetheinyl transferase family protein n=1 Tax=Paenibacillus sp. JSM ZJ436 TaxID=3376190 RepID=UPI00379229CE